ncbi:MAG: DUF6340 family protein [Bacteroidota bacterium]|nr:DUF6340 family protein [Bacteroidota bacterium]
MNCSFFCILLIAILGFASSCVTTYNMSSIQVEILKPGFYTMPENIDTIAIFKRDLFQSDTIAFRYSDGDNKKMLTDKLISYRDLSNNCVDALADFLSNEGYFLKIINYKDSMNYLFSRGDSLINYPELHKKSGADAFIFLDFFLMEDHLINNTGYYSDNGIIVIEQFPEFRRSSRLETVNANLLWTVSFKGDSSVYLVKQPDNLYYGNSVYPELFGNDINHRLLLKNASEYLGKAFGAKIVPTWLKVERSYYRSRNDNMLAAEKLCLNGEYLKAAEIYKRETKNKNRNIAAKARYNMALLCEMEGKPDAAIDWLALSFSAYKQNNEEHKFNCQQYINILALRKKEIERLGKQVREKSGTY